MISCFSGVVVFFFQAEDGIRDWSVTGVQTCALPIYRRAPCLLRQPFRLALRRTPSLQNRVASSHSDPLQASTQKRGDAPGGRYVYGARRSEERRVGKEGRSGWWAYQ